VKPKQQGTTQAYSAMGRVVHRRGSIEARHLQAIEQKGEIFTNAWNIEQLRRFFP
jgi:hypothetical protein